jgi:hypothetical protein
VKAETVLAIFIFPSELIAEGYMDIEVKIKNMSIFKTIKKYIDDRER